MYLIPIPTSFNVLGIRIDCVKDRLCGLMSFNHPAWVLGLGIHIVNSSSIKVRRALQLPFRVSCILYMHLCRHPLARRECWPVAAGQKALQRLELKSRFEL